MPWKRWRQHFERNRTRPLPPLDGELGIPSEWRDHFTSSMGRFLLGETGEGRIVNEIRRARLSGVDDDYREALRLFIAEEGRHARILGEILKRMDSKAPGHHWTERVFRKGRRLMGVRLKLVVLLSAEVIAEGFYGAMADALPQGQIRAALEQIIADEGDHLDFHIEFLRLQTGGRAGRAAFLVTWWTVAGTGCAVVMFDHRTTLRAAGVSLPDLGVRLARLIRDTGDKVVSRTDDLADADNGVLDRSGGTESPPSGRGDGLRYAS